MTFCLQDIANELEVYDFKGVSFRHIGSLMLNPEKWRFTIDSMYNLIKHLDIDCFIGLESRGFLFTEIATKANASFVMVRKSGKLPGITDQIFYGKEYGHDVLQIMIDDVSKLNGKRIMIIDDLSATGGSINAAKELLTRHGCNVVGSLVLIELLNHSDVSNLENHFSLLKFDINSRSKQLYKPEALRFNPLNEGIFSDEKEVVFYSTTSLNLAKNYVSNNLNSRLGNVLINYFNDGKPNFMFEKRERLENKKIIFFLSLFNLEKLSEDLSLITALIRQGIDSLDIYIPYYSVGTMERVNEEGVLATAETIPNQIAGACIGFPANIHIYDIHALQEQFYFPDPCVVVKRSGIDLLLKEIDRKDVIVFPDDGSYKRFSSMFRGFKMIICSKQRIGDKRVVQVSEYKNFPTITEFEFTGRYIIVDDLVQSGGTLLEVANLLKSLGYTRICAYVTHAVFPLGSHKKMLGHFETFYTTNSISENVDILSNYSMFKILNLFGNTNPTVKVYVSSKNKDKLRASYEFCKKNLRNVFVEIYGVECNSGVPNQPLEEQTFEGAENRMKELRTLYSDGEYYFSLENGIINSQDVCIGIFEHKNPNLYICDSSTGGLLAHNFKSEGVKIDDFYLEKIRLNQNKTIGQLIEEYEGIPNNMWHEFKSGKSRYELMSEMFIKKSL